jgi:lipoprotein-releasing system permease protein
MPFKTFRLKQQHKLACKMGLRYVFPFKNKHGLCSLRPSVASVIAFLGLFLSVSVLIIVVSVFNGFKIEFVKTIIGVNSHITIYPSANAKLLNSEPLLNQIKLQKGVVNALPVINGQALMSFNDYSQGILVKGFSLDAFKQKQILQNSVLSGNIEDLESDKWYIFLGNELAASIGAKKGDVVKLIAPRLNHTLFGLIPVHKDFVVGGIFSLKMSHYDANLAIIGIKKAELFFDKSQGEVSAIEIDTSDITYIDNTLDYLHLRGLNAVSFEDDNAGYISAIKIQSTVMNFILSLFVIVSIFIVFGIVRMLINEKSKDIAVLKTMGFEDKFIRNIFTSSGLGIAVCGIVCGNIFGIAFALNIDSIKNFLEAALGVTIFDGAFYFLSYLPSKVYLKDLVIINIFCTCLSLAAILKAVSKTKLIMPSLLIK